RLGGLAPPPDPGLGGPRLSDPGAAATPKTGGVGLSLWQLLGELQVLLAWWAGAYPVCKRPAPRWPPRTGPPRAPTCQTLLKRLLQAEHVALGVSHIDDVPLARDGALLVHGAATRVAHALDCSVDIVHLDPDDRRLRLELALHDGAVDARALAGGGELVALGEWGALGPPPDRLGVEVRGPLEVVGGDLEMHDPSHRLLPSLLPAWVRA